MLTSTLRPGLLVSPQDHRIAGNVSYRTLTLEGDHITEDGARRARWETERTVVDPPGARGSHPGPLPGPLQDAVRLRQQRLWPALPGEQG